MTAEVARQYLAFLAIYSVVLALVAVGFIIAIRRDTRRMNDREKFLRQLLKDLDKGGK